jgi:hypothetical protein
MKAPQEKSQPFAGVSIRLASFNEGMVRPERFELPACCFGGNRSIQLSYGRAKARTTLRLSLPSCASKGFANRIAAKSARKMAAILYPGRPYCI